MILLGALVDEVTTLSLIIDWVDLDLVSNKSIDSSLQLRIETTYLEKTGILESYSFNY